MGDNDGGLFNIEVSPSDDSGDQPQIPRDYQSEADFQHQKVEWKPKNEVGEIWKTFNLPMNNPSKPEAQTMLHAIEELYFFRRFEEAGKLADDVLGGKLNEEFRKTILAHKAKCQAKFFAGTRR